MFRSIISVLVIFVLIQGVFPVMATLELPVTEHTLSNGMEVLAVERPDAPVVALALYYRVGSVDEVPGKTGIAHYCEHMMFKSTEHLKGEAFAKLMGTIGGGFSNANTSFDRTCYHESVSPDRLEFVIRLEAERMGHLNPGRKEAASELEVIQEELRNGYVDNPSGRLRFELYQKAYDVHPYKTITIGHLADLKTFSWDDLMAFQRRFYVPSNAVAVFVGNFKTSVLLELLETHFGSLPAGDPVVRRFSTEPSHESERHFELDIQVQRSMVWAGYHIPGAANRDNLTLQVLGTILSRGGSSPLGRLAQGENPVAMYAHAWSRASLEPGLFILNGMTLPGIAPEVLLRRIDEEILKIQAEGVTESQLETARTQLLAQETFNMQSCMGIAKRLGEAEMVSTWHDAVNLADHLASITIEEVKIVAGKYLVSGNRTIGFARADQDRVIDDQTQNNQEADDVDA
ncbi:insulinase family protein [bacterium]|nr:insulinase family protein [bacterium]